MDLTGIGEAASAAEKVIGMIFPDKTEHEKNQLAVTLGLLNAQTQQNLAQIEVNRVAAASSNSPFARNARPFIIWVCGAAFAYQYLAWPFLVWFSLNLHGSPPPKLDVSDVMALVLPLLGISGLRSFDKTQLIGK